MNTLTLIDTGLTTEELIIAAYAEGARDAAERMASEVSILCTEVMIQCVTSKQP